MKQRFRRGRGAIRISAKGGSNAGIGMAKPENPVRMAEIGAPHGVRGEVRVRTYTGEPLALADYGPLADAGGRVFTIEAIRQQGPALVVKFAGIADRNAAAALNGTALYVDRSALPDDVEEEQYYHADLVGLEVRDGGGTAIGRVVSVQNYGGGDILEIALGGDREVMVPFSRAAVPVVDLGARFLTIDRTAAGLDEAPSAEPDRKGHVRTRPRGPKSAGGNR